jgi:hypothetical protein
MSKFRIVGAVLFFGLAGQPAAFAQEAVQEPGMEAFYYPNADVTRSGAYAGNAYARWGDHPYDANAYYDDQVGVNNAYSRRRPAARVYDRSNLQH